MIFRSVAPYRAMALVLSLALYALIPVYAQQESPATATATAAARERTVRVTLLQVNDVYQISPVDRGTRGGLERLATLRGRIVAESPHTLYLLGGDTIAPSVASNIFKGRQMIALWNATGLDYAVLGNHEFDFGDAVLRERMKESRFGWLGANVIDRQTGKPFGDMPPFVVREFGGIKVGLFGVLTPDTARASKAGPDVEFRDPCETAKKTVPLMRAAGAQVIVALTHLTMSQDKEMARCAPIDVIIGGHEHTVLQSLAGRTPIFKMGSDGRNLGRIDLNISGTTGALDSIDWEVIPVTSDIPEEPASAALAAEYEKTLSVELDQFVGRTSVALDARQETNRTQETNLGSFIADAYRKWAGADVALMNSGSVRSNTTFGPGALTKRDVLSILPFENHIVKVEVKGAILRAALEYGVSRVVEDKEAGQFPQVSGLAFVFDERRPAGSRILSVTVAGRPLDDTKTYTLASNAYVIGGGDGYKMFRGARYLLEPEEGPVEATVLMDAIAAAKEIAPRTDGRIKRLGR